jgi:hypothetical protein
MTLIVLIFWEIRNVELEFERLRKKPLKYHELLLDIAT